MASSILNLRRYRFKSAVRGYKYYTESTPAQGTIYPCRREPDNKHDKNAVAVYREDGGILGYVPKEHSKLYSTLLKLPPPVTLQCIIGKPFYTPSKGKGHQLHCEYVFESSEENIRIIRDKLELKEALEISLSRRHSDIIGKLIKEIEGIMKIRRIVLCGAPLAGKTSIKRLMLNLPPLSKEKEQSTPLLESPVRLISTDRFTTVGDSHDCLKIVENEEMMIQMIAKEVHKRLLKNKENESHEHKGVQHESTQQPILPKSTHHQPILVQETNSNKIPATSSEDSSVRQVEYPGTDHSKVIRKISTDLLKLAHSGSQHVDPLYSVNWTHVIDSGGQPEFADLLPLVFPSEKNLYFVVIPLDEDFHEKPTFQYCIDGENCIDSPRSLALTYYEMIERMCKMAKLSNSSVKIIGTRLDCIDEEVLKKKEEELKDLKEKYSDVIIFNGNETAILALNAVEKDASKRKEYIQKLKEVALTSDSCWCIEETIPLSWIVLQLVMSRESRNGVISYTDVKQNGDILKIDETSLKDALTFFSDLALNFYFPNVIDDIILEKIDVVTHNLSQLVTATYEIPTNRSQNEQQITFKKTGLFYKSLLSKLPSLCFGNTFTEEHFLKIIQHLKVIHCIDNGEYFFPGILPLAPATYSTDADSRRYHPHPLLIFWKDAPLPHAFFSAVIVALLRKENISLCRAVKRNRYRDVMYLTHKNGVMLLVDCTYWMELYNCSPTNDFWNIRTIVWSACEEVLESLKLKSLTSTCIFGLLCSYDECQHARHPCTPISIAKCQFQCHKEEMNNWIESNSERLQWFQRNTEVVDVIGGDHETTTSGRKRSSPSRNEITNTTKLSPIHHRNAKEFKKLSPKLLRLISPSSFTSLIVALWSKYILSETLFTDLLSSEKDHSKKCAQLIQGIHHSLETCTDVTFDTVANVFISIDRSKFNGVFNV